ncbi:GNAT family N-acetyltransferase [Oerskovia sp. NPDC057915]|uniref:GNAT family N-acetyltransferase n=1 Tax=Oerskovia sp. NPDC057915 TaxID=3346280 RepID=UPI0036DAAD57
MTDATTMTLAPTQSDVTVRRATTADREDLWLLVVRLQPDAPDRATHDRVVGPLLRALDTLLLVAEDTTGVVGYLLASQRLTFTANGAVVEIDEIAVDPAADRTTVASQLVAAVEAWGQEFRATRVTLADVLPREVADGLGYTTTEVRSTKALALLDADPVLTSPWDGPAVPAQPTPDDEALPVRDQ